MTYRKSILAVILCLAACLCAGCASSAGSIGEYGSASSVPNDFWLSITVMGPVRSGPSPYDKLGGANRPARYVIESDRILRAALGPGASDGAFPPQSRRLNASQVADIWSSVRESEVLMRGHPDAASIAPPPETVLGQTVYVITTAANARRQTVVIAVEPTPGPMADRAKPLVEKVAALAWVK